MSDVQPWYELLDQLIGREGLSRRQVAQRADVKTKTITSWVRGDVGSPRSWQQLAKVLHSLHADRHEANQIIQRAGHPPIHRLATRATEKEQALLANWIKSDAPFMPPERSVAALIGRKKEIQQATEALKLNRRCVLLGMGGVGKTTLAIEIAHQLQHEFPDGVFWGDQRISSPSAILGSWGQACAVPMMQLTDFKSRAAAMRTLFARKKALIVLDDVIDSQIALQMIPSHSRGCAVLVTTRSEDAARALTRQQKELAVRLTPMKRQHSMTLLSTILGQDAVEGNQATVEQIAVMAGDLPLALHICGALCVDAGLSLEHMATLLSQLQSRLALLQLEEKPLVRLAFEQSWLLLNEKAQKSFATLALFAGRPFGTAAFAASAALSIPEAALMLTQLCRRSLLTIVKSEDRTESHYQQHTLLAAFSAEKLPHDHGSWQRFSEYYLQLIQTPNWSQGAALERWGNVMAGMESAYQRQNWTLVLSYNDNLTEAWRRQGHYHFARQGYSWASEAANMLADRKACATINLNWGIACLEQSTYEPAHHHFMTALSLFEAQDNSFGVANTHYNLARLFMEQGQHNNAEVEIQKAWQVYNRLEDPKGMGRALYLMGNITYHRGNYQQAADLAKDAIHSQERVGDKLGLLRSNMLASSAYLQLKAFETADYYCQKASTLLEAVNDQAETAIFYYTYADVLRKKREYTKSRRVALNALKLFQKMSDINNEVNTLILLAGIEVNWNDAEPARKQVQEGLARCCEALELCDLIGYRVGRGFLLLMKGRLLFQAERQAEARISWQEGLQLAKQLGHSWLERRLQQLIDENYPDG